jgi:transcriptional regulator with XRE-family HTH domain
MSKWAERIRELQAAGMTLAEIGARIGLATSTVGDLANGRSESPRGEAALKLHSLHENTCRLIPEPDQSA